MKRDVGSSSGLVVAPVRSRAEQKQFLQLPWQLYAGDPNWIPPLLMDHRGLVGFKHHPFYDDAEICTFLVTRDGRTCGRLAAIVNHAHNRRAGEKRGFFGFFESIDDEQVSRALFDAACGWLRAGAWTRSAVPRIRRSTTRSACSSRASTRRRLS